MVASKPPSDIPSKDCSSVTVEKPGAKYYSQPEEGVYIDAPVETLAMFPPTYPAPKVYPNTFFTESELEELSSTTMDISHVGREYGCQCDWCSKMNEIIARKK